MEVCLIELPYHLGHERIGMGRGPARWLEAGAEHTLVERGHRVQVDHLRLEEDRAGEIGAVFELNRRLARAVREAVAEDAFPLVLAGNCSSSLGTLAGLADPSLGVVWFDAHGDFNTPETTRSGFFDGMALAVATGRCWGELAATVPGFRPLAEDRVVLVAARDLDPGERRLLEGSRVHRVPAGPDLLPRLEAALDEVRSRTRDVYVHVDLDALDPTEAPANAYAAAGGLSLEQAGQAIARVRDAFRVRAAALTAYDPEWDPRGAACRAGLRLMQALTEDRT